MDEMNIGQCIDYVEEWIKNNNKEQSENATETNGRKATQADFNSF